LYNYYINYFTISGKEYDTNFIVTTPDVINIWGKYGAKRRKSR